MSRDILNKILIVLILLVLTSCFLVSYAEVFNPSDTGSEQWEELYIINDFILAWIFIPFPLLFVVYLLLKQGILKKVISVILLGMSLIAFILAMEALVFISPDLMPSAGTYLSALLFPLVTLYLLLSRYRYLKNRTAISKN